MKFDHYQACFVHCKNLIKNHEYEEAMTCSHQLLDLYEDSQDDIKLENVFSGVEAFFLNVPNGILHLTYLNRLAKLYEDQNMYDQQLSVLYDMAQDYIDATEYTLAKSILNRGILQSRTMNLPHRECDFLNGLGRISNVNGHYEKGLQYYKSAYQKALDSHYTRGRRFAHNIGYTLGRLKKYEEAVGYFNETIHHMCSESNPSYCANTYNELGYIYIQLKEFEKGQKTLEKAYQLCIESGSYFFLAENYLFQSQLYEMHGNIKKALEYYKVYHEQHQKISKKQNKQQLKNYAYEKTLEKRLSENEAIRLKNIELDNYAKALDAANKSLEASLNEISALEDQAHLNQANFDMQANKMNHIFELKNQFLKCYDLFLDLNEIFDSSELVHIKKRDHIMSQLNTSFDRMLEKIKSIEKM